ncbi:MAG: hypothetical protein KKE57_03630 [Proteobacteria bacterium]|nr:hypothetical protein [Pseudomonadota bacterium]
MTNWDEIYDRIINRGPSSETLFEVLSRLKASGHLTRVVQECIRALASYPDNIPLRHLLAETYFELDLLSQAEAEVEKVTTRLDDLASAYKLHANIYHRQKRDEDSARALKVYLAHRPDDADALHLLERVGEALQEPAPEPAAVEGPPPAFHEAASEGPLSSAEGLGEGSPISEGEAFPEIATPTLAEIYFSQGQIPEAVNTYEMVLAQDPEDERSRQRLDELKAMVSAAPLMKAKGVDKKRVGKEKMIAILEAWLAGIRKMSGNAMPR